MPVSRYVYRFSMNIYYLCKSNILIICFPFCWKNITWSNSSDMFRDNTWYGCGASILSCNPVLIITAAHCVHNVFTNNNNINGEIKVIWPAIYRMGPHNKLNIGGTKVLHHQGYFLNLILNKVYFCFKLKWSIHL